MTDLAAKLESVLNRLERFLERPAVAPRFVTVHGAAAYASLPPDSVWNPNPVPALDQNRPVSRQVAGSHLAAIPAQRPAAADIAAERRHVHRLLRAGRLGGPLSEVGVATARGTLFPRTVSGPENRRNCLPQNKIRDGLPSPCRRVFR
jgi:hypothetical protein